MGFVKGFFSSLITIILIPIIMVFIIYLSTRNIVSKQGVKDFFKEVNFSDVLIDNKGNYTNFGKEIKDKMVNAGIPAETIDEFVNSEQISDFFSNYTGDIVGYIIYDADMDDIDANDISKLINDNIDDIVDELRERKVDGYEELTDERVNEIKSKVNDLSKEIEDKLPDVKKTVEDSDYSLAIKIIRVIFSKAMIMVFITIIAILALLIILLNLKNYRYGIWLGVIFIISSFPFVILGNANVVVTTDSVYSQAIKDAIKFGLNKTSSTALIFFIIGIALIVFTIIMRIIKKCVNKKANNNVTPVQTEPVQPVEQPIEQPIEQATVQPAIEPEPINTNETAVPNVFGVSLGEEVKPTETPAVNEEISTPINSEVVSNSTELSGEEGFCAECGAKLNAGQNFCYNCGATKK